MFKLALERLPSGRNLCSQSTISRLENLPEKRTLLRLAQALVELYCASFRQVSRRITLDIDDTFDAVHGGQQLRLFNAHHDDYGFQPIVVFDQDGRFVTALLRPATRPKGGEIRAFLRRLIRAIRGNWPNVEILVRADSHYACPEILDWCEANGLDYVLGLAPTRTPKRHVTGIEASSTARFKADFSAAKVRRFKEFFDAAGSCSRVRRIVARVEAGSDGTDTRFIVTNLGNGSGRSLYQDLYCRRGQAENHIKAWRSHLAADGTLAREFPRGRQSEDQDARPSNGLAGRQGRGATAGAARRDDCCGGEGLESSGRCRMVMSSRPSGRCGGWVSIGCCRGGRSGWPRWRWR